MSTAKCPCGGTMVPHIAHQVGEEIDWSKAVGLECENRCGYQVTIADLQDALCELVESGVGKSAVDTYLDLTTPGGKSLRELGWADRVGPDPDRGPTGEAVERRP